MFNTTKHWVLISILGILGASQGWAQQNTNPAGGTSTWSGLMPQTRLPQAGNDGQLKGSSVTERMDSIRRRPIDASIARPFGAEDQGFGDGPTVKRRPLTAMPEPVVPAAKVQVEPVPQAEPIQVEPAPQVVESIPTLPTIAPTAVPTAAPTTVAVPSTPINVVPISPAFSNVSPVSPQPTAPAANVLLSNSGPALSFQTAGPRKIMIGKRATYRVKMINKGSIEANNVICSIQLPSWAEVSAEAATTGTHRVDPSEAAGNIVRWTIDSIKAGGDETLTLAVVPRDGRPFDLAVGWAFAPDKTMAQIEVQEPKLELALNGSEEVLYGDKEVLTVTLSNPGTGDVENVVLNLVPLSSKQQITGSRDIGTIKAGQRKSIELELTAHQAGRLLVKAMAFADDGLRSEASHEVLVRRANLDVAVMGPPRHYAATTATYKVRVENTGDAVADTTSAVASLPAGAKFLSSTDGGKFEQKRGQVEWSVGSLRPGAVRVFEFQCELNSAGDNRVDVQCRAATDLSVAKSVTTHVEALADLKLYVNDPQGAIAVGDNAEYEVRVINRGTKVAENVRVVGYFSEGIEPESVSGGKGEVMTGQVELEPIAMIQPGQEVVFRIAARASSAGDHVFRAELQCQAPQTRLATEEWTKFYGPNSQPRQQLARPIAPAGRPLR